MNIREVIYSVLSTHVGLTALIGSKLSMKEIEQGLQKPYVYFEMFNITPVSSINGDSGTVDASIRVYCIDKSLMGSVGVAAQVKSALQRYKGVVLNVEVIDSFVVDEGDSYRSDSNETTTEVEFEISYR